MKSIFKSKKGLGLLGATFMVIAGCTSDDVNYDIPVNSNDLIDQNVVYKSETVAVDVEEKPQINSTDIAKSDSVNDTEKTVSKNETPVAKSETKVVEETEPKKEIVNAKTEPTEIDVAAEVAKAKAEAEENAKLMADDKVVDSVDDKNDKTEVIVPPPAHSDKTIRFTKSSYTEAVSEDDEFARAVAEAEARRSTRANSSKPETQHYTREEKVKIFEDGIPKSKSIIDSTQKMRDNRRKSYKLDVKDLPVEDRERNITFLSTVIYHSNAKADISARDERTLRNVANFAKKNDAILRVVGNSSSRSKNMKESQNKIANFDLSILRAQKVRDLLVKFGVPSDKVFISAVSDTEKISEENMPINEAVNRRTEIYINY